MSNRLFSKIRDVCGNFASAESGNTVVTFALAFIPLVGLTGAAVDYSPPTSCRPPCRSRLTPLH